MEMNAPVAAERDRRERHGQIGQPIDRVDGPLKVTGRAPYAYEVRDGASRPTA